MSILLVPHTHYSYPSFRPWIYVRYPLLFVMIFTFGFLSAMVTLFRVFTQPLSPYLFVFLSQLL
jgi:hypothetical protein